MDFLKCLLFYISAAPVSHHISTNKFILCNNYFLISLEGWFSFLVENELLNWSKHPLCSKVAIHLNGTFNLTSNTELTCVVVKS